MTSKSRQNSPTIKQLCNLAGVVLSVLSGLSFEQVQYLLNKKSVLKKKLASTFEVPADIYAGLRVEWERFYLDHFRIAVDFSEVHIPEKPNEGLWRPIFVAQGLSLNSTLAVMRDVFPKVWTYSEDLDANVPTNTRTSAQSYVVWVRDGVEPDQEFLGKSTREADMDGKVGVTFLERLVFGVKLFVEKKEHLDVRGITLCTASRSIDGGVPCVYFYPNTGEVIMFWYFVDYSYASFGLRQAVS